MLGGLPQCAEQSDLKLLREGNTVKHTRLTVYLKNMNKGESNDLKTSELSEVQFRVI